MQLSVIESTKSAGFAFDRKVEIVWIDTEKIEKGVKKEWQKVESVAGFIVPGGFGTRGIEGKIVLPNMLVRTKCRIWVFVLVRRSWRSSLHAMFSK